MPHLKIPILLLVSLVKLSTSWQCSPGTYDLYTLYPELAPSFTKTTHVSLGEGTTGQVELSTNSLTPTAIKLFSLEDSTNSPHLIRQEYYYGNTLLHPNLASSYSLEQRPDSTYAMEMEYIPFSLLDILDEDKFLSRPWTLPEIFCIFHQLLNGITHMHTHGIAHRDIKIENLMITQYGHLKIIDLGSASLFRDPLTEDEVRSLENRVGTPITMPPEADGEELMDLEKADVWALGIVLVRLWLGVYPWGSATIEDEAFSEFVRESEHSKNKKGGYECENRKDETLICVMPPELQGIVDGMLQLDPDERLSLDDLLKSEWMRNSIV